MSAGVEGAWREQVVRRPTQPLGLALTLMGGLTLVVMLLWGGLVVASPPSGGLAEQIAALRSDARLYRWSLVNASLINPAIVAVLVLLLAVPGRRRLAARDYVGVTLLLAYLPVPLIAYGAQYAQLPQLLDSGSTSAALWYFNNPDSFAYVVTLVGDAMFGVGAALLAVRMLNEAGPLGWAGMALLCSGLLSVLGFVGYLTGVAFVEVANLVGAVFVAPVAALAIVIGRQLSARADLDGSPRGGSPRR